MFVFYQIAIRMKKLVSLLLTLMIAFFGLSSSAQTVDSLKVKAVENGLEGALKSEGQKPWSIQERMTYYHIKGLSIAVICNYKLVWAKGYGWADDSLKIPVTTQTLFQAASLSKSLNSVGVLKLLQDKKLDIYADINNYLSSWKFPYDSLSKGKKISMANLLSHTGGITVHGFDGYERGTVLPTLQQVLDGQKPANSDPIRSMFAPGLKSEYSGGGITISQEIVTDITHQPYDKFMYEKVLKPMGMTSSTYQQPPNDKKQELLATGYRPDGAAIKGRYHIYPEQAAAGLWTNPTDLSKYIIETQLAYEGRSSKVLNQQTTKLRLTPYLDKQAALGVFLTDLDGTTYFRHSGANEGFRSDYFGSLEGGNGLVIMVNSDNGQIMPEIENAIARVYGFKGLYQSKLVTTTSVADSVLQTYTGEYELVPGFSIAVTREGGHLFGQGTGQPKFELYPETQTKFFLKVVDAKMEFIKDDKGQVIKAILYQNGEHEAKKVK